MSSGRGALLQLVAYAGFEGSTRSSIESIAQEQIFREFGSSHRVTIPRTGDLLAGSYIQMTLPALPQGLEWKPNAFLRVVKKANLYIAGSLVDSITSDTMELLNEAHDSLFFTPQRNPNGTIDISIPLFNNIQPIRIICIPYNEIHYTIEFERLQDLVHNPSGSRYYMPQFTGKLVHNFVFLDQDQRRIMIHTINRQNDPFYTDAASLTKTIDVSPDSPTYTFPIYHHNISPYAIILIRDQNGNPIPQYQVLDTITPLINDQPRISGLTGYEARSQQWRLLPHSAVRNFRTHPDTNLYAISYNFEGRTNNFHNMLEGLNMSRISSYSIRLKFRDDVVALPEFRRFRVTIYHRTYNNLMYQNNMSGIQLTYTNTQEQNPVQNISSIQVASIQPTVNPTLMRTIDVHVGTDCIIMGVPIEEGVEVDECQRCKKVFLTTAIQQWQASTINAATRSCPHCRAAYTQDTFKRGKARILNIQQPTE
jgi:hypothetical protein